MIASTGELAYQRGKSHRARPQQRSPTSCRSSRRRSPSARAVKKAPSHRSRPTTRLSTSGRGPKVATSRSNRSRPRTPWNQSSSPGACGPRGSSASSTPSGSRPFARSAARPLGPRHGRPERLAHPCRLPSARSASRLRGCATGVASVSWRGHVGTTWGGRTLSSPATSGWLTTLPPL